MNNSNLTQHKCKGKCPEFKGEQCNHCLVAQVEKREFELGVAPDDAYVKTIPLQNSLDFLQGDTVVLIAPVTLVNRTFDTADLLSVEYITPLGGIGVTTNGVIVVVVDPTEVRHATTLELKLKRRLTKAEQALAEVP
ncbi:hypothetical protein [Acinetobacter sp. ANC 4204]|uniref:hypothetical protein n=1 Tax=Acinetobacter sp. ANC 4204 TaxID=1977884 RepID=UPI001D177669|nr:hypothetical protein [Acinetobacter sp. ANC 4204]